MIPGALIFILAVSFVLSKKNKGSNDGYTVSTSKSKGSAKLIKEIPDILKTLDYYVYDRFTGEWSVKKGNYRKTYKPGEVFEYSGLVMGTFLDDNKEYYLTEMNDGHNILIAGSGSGKTRKSILESVYIIAKARQSMVITDIKGELTPMIYPFLKEQGYDVYYLNTEDPSISSTIDIFASIQDAYDQYKITGTESALNVSIGNFIDTLFPNGNSKSDSTWDETARGVLRGIIILIMQTAKKREDKVLRSLVKTLQLKTLRQDETPSELDLIFEKLPDDNLAKGVLAGFVGTTDKVYDSHKTTVLSKIKAYDGSDINSMLGIRDFDPKSLGQKPTVLIINVNTDAPEYLPIINILYREIISNLKRYANDNLKTGVLPTKVNFLLDEFAQPPPIKGFVSDLTTLRSFGVRLNIVVQDTDQIKEKYKDGMNTILGSALNTIFFGSQNLTTNKYFSDMIGSQTIEEQQVSRSVSGNKDNGGSTTTSTQKSSRPIYYDYEMRIEISPKTGKALILPQGGNAIEFQPLDLSRLFISSELGFPTIKDCHPDDPDLIKLREKIDTSQLETVEKKRLTDEQRKILARKGIKTSKKKYDTITIDSYKMTELVRQKNKLEVEDHFKRKIDTKAWMLNLSDTRDFLKSQNLMDIEEKEDDINFDEFLSEVEDE